MDAIAESIPLIDDDADESTEEAFENSADIDKEFEDYLNENEDYDTVVSSDSEDAFNTSGAASATTSNNNSEDFDDFFRKESESTKRGKLSELERAEYSIDNLEHLRRLALDKYGFMNKNIRRKAWPVLILSRNKGLDHGAIPEFLETSINEFDQISNFLFLIYSFQVLFLDASPSSC
jgi:hypothetical protein